MLQRGGGGGGGRRPHSHSCIACRALCGCQVGATRERHCCFRRLSREHADTRQTHTSHDPRTARHLSDGRSLRRPPSCFSRAAPPGGSPFWLTDTGGVASPHTTSDGGRLVRLLLFWPDDGVNLNYQQLLTLLDPCQSCRIIIWLITPPFRVFFFFSTFFLPRLNVLTRNHNILPQKSKILLNEDRV